MNSTARSVAALASAGTGALVVWGGRKVAEQRQRRLDRLALRPDAVGLMAQTVQLTSVTGSPLHAWWVEGRPGAPAVLVVHGYASHAGDLLQVAPALVAAGMSVLLLDLRGHGRSAWEGRPTPQVFAEDLEVGLDWLAANELVGAVALLGHSMGGSAVIRAAARHPEVQAVVAVAAVADPTLTAIGVWPAGVNKVLMDRMARRTGIDPSVNFARNVIGLLDIPVLLVHGELDRVVPVRHAHVLKKAQPNAELLVLPEANHSDLDLFAEAFPTVVGFLRRELVASSG